MKTNTSRFASRTALLFAFVVAATVARPAIPVGDSNVQIGGFFSQGWLYSDNNNYPTADKGGTWDFREMAFNASTTFGSHLRVGGQVFAQRLGDLGEDHVILDWAVADYNFNPAFGIRAGRVKYPKGLYGEALDLDIVRPFVFLPGAVYSPILRDFSASFDGGMFYGSINVGKGSFDYKVFAGRIPMTPSQGVSEFYNNAGLYAAPGATALGMDSVAGGQLTWNTPVNGLKFVYSYSQFKNLHTDGPFVAYPPVDVASNIELFTWHTISVEYTLNSWVFAAEWQRSHGDFGYNALPLLPPTIGPVGWDGWYVSAARRLNDKYQVGAYYGNLQTDVNFSGSNPADYQHDIAVCLRYDYNEHIVFKIEGHYIDGTYQTFDTVRIPNPPAARKNDTTVIAVKTTFSF
ncbi:MAG TPA: hypothetical protein VGM73_04680 [Candidatus Didemnitutus sp.]|jgi:hypothetical protein